MAGYPSENSWVSEVKYNRIIENKKTRQKNNSTQTEIITKKINANKKANKYPSRDMNEMGTWLIQTTAQSSGTEQHSYSFKFIRLRIGKQSVRLAEIFHWHIFAPRISSFTKLIIPFGTFNRTNQ